MKNVALVSVLIETMPDPSIIPGNRITGGLEPPGACDDVNVMLSRRDSN